MTDYEASGLGKSASLVLENPAYIEAMASLQRAVVAQWKACPIRDREAQTITLQKMRLAEDFEAILRGMVEGGKMADDAIRRNADIDKHRDENIAVRLGRRLTR